MLSQKGHSSERDEGSAGEQRHWLTWDFDKLMMPVIFGEQYQSAQLPNNSR